MSRYMSANVANWVHLRVWELPRLANDKIRQE